MAGGWLLAQMCDLCIASENASFAITEAKVGRGRRSVGHAADHAAPADREEELLLTARQQARAGSDLGYVNAVVPQDNLRAAAVEMALVAIARNAPLTVRAARQADID